MPAVDCHAHVFDLKRFPVQDSRGFDIQANELGTAKDYISVLDAHGMSHALLVNPLGGYGIDNRCMLAAIAEGKGRFKGVSLLPPDITEARVRELVDAGVVGIRFNLNFEKSPSLYGKAGERSLAIARDVGWLIQVHYEGETIVPAVPVLLASRLTVVVDHFGRPEVSHGLGQPGFQALLELGRQSAVVKLSAGFRASQFTQGEGYSDLDPFADALLANFSIDRCVWGSDWPFLRARSRIDYGPQLNSLKRWIPDEADRKRILWDNPARIFGFRAG
ncbi:MAG: amidohydrolase family protein [Xanthobacteraceae bacterium]